MKASIIGQLEYLSTLIDQLFKNHEYEREQMRKVYAKFWLVCTSGDFGVKTIKSEFFHLSQIEIMTYNMVSATTSLRRDFRFEKIS